MPTLEASIEFEVYCSKHPTNKLKSDTERKRGFDHVLVEPCDECMGEEYEQGMKDGTATKGEAII